MAERVQTLVLDKTDLVLSSFPKTLQLIIFSVLCFAVPFLLGHPQLLVGSIINALLMLAALNFRKTFLWPIILLPSIAVLTKGMIFGPFTIFLVYMVPIIWLGNFVFVWGMKYFFLHKHINRRLSLGISAVIKTALLFSVAFVLVKIGTLPALFLTSMGLFQLYTALIGGAVALGYQTLYKRRAH